MGENAPQPHPLDKVEPLHLMLDGIQVNVEDAPGERQVDNVDHSGPGDDTMATNFDPPQIEYRYFLSVGYNCFAQHPADSH